MKNKLLGTVHSIYSYFLSPMILEGQGYFGCAWDWPVLPWGSVSYWHCKLHPNCKSPLNCRHPVLLWVPLL